MTNGSRPPLRGSMPLGLLALLLGAAAATAQDGWSPFTRDWEARQDRAGGPASAEASRPPPLAPMNGPLPSGERSAPRPVGRDIVGREPLPPLDERSRAVERDELRPVMADDGSGLPYELWRGLDAQAIEVLFSAIDIPPRSPALATLWRRLITSHAMPAVGSSGAGHFTALRVEALTRSGLIKEAGEAVARLPLGQQDALAAVLTARNETALGRRDTACEAIRSAPAAAPVPNALKADAILISGYCAVTGGNAAAAGLTADLAREHGVETGAGLAALEALATGTKPDLRGVKRISPLDYRLITLAGGAEGRLVIEKSTPATLAAIALDPAAGADLRIAAGEAALRLNAITATELAAIYRTRAAASADVTPAATQGSDPADGHRRRAALFVAAESERTPLKKVRLIRSFLDEARRAGFYLPALEMMGPVAHTVAPAAEIGWFAETAIEIALLAGHYDRARALVAFASSADTPLTSSGRGPLEHWLALVDIADPKRHGARGTALATVEELALTGRLASDLLHRLATVLDALDAQVPIPLWEAASRAPQPAGGHLPETGVLSELLEASKKKEFGRTVLVAMNALGPTGAEGAHMIALGDSIRALRRAGLESDARRLGLEALFASWPRAAAY